MMSAALSKRNCIKKLSFFQDLNDQQIDEMAASLVEIRFHDGQTIFSHDEHGDSLYMLMEGKVELFIHDYVGDKITLKVVTPGDYFGELAVLGGGKRTATATALEPCMCYELTRNQLLDFLHRKPNAAIEILASLSRAISATNTMLSNRIARNADDDARRETPASRTVQAFAALSGSFPFLLLNSLWIIFWIFWNMEMIPGSKTFDPYPFGLLTCIVSIEAIFLAILILMSQARYGMQARAHNDIEYEVSLKSELEIANLHQKIDSNHEEYLKYLNALTQQTQVKS